MNTQKQKTVIVVAGPTAVGKTAVAIALAQQLHASIISADSRQCYRELSIGVARPSEAELAAVPHYFIASHSIEQEVNAGVFEQYALATAEDLFRTDDMVVMVGGTGLYIKAFCEGMDDIPAADTATRNKITARYREEGLAWLQEEVKAKDPLFWQTAEQQNPQRLMRALEVFETTGKSIIDFRQNSRAERPFRIIKTALEQPREILYERINQRVDLMMQEGLEAETRSVYPHRDLNALQTVGYKEMFGYFDGELTLQQAVDAIKQNTRHYAKRQLTWFRKDPAFTWLQPDENAVGSIMKLL
ncbi:tRNA (adenosine(37)-N6)-dimethylallyltransferase MiaA [Sediminibacterium ginsengisoli]|uniref:tRNA dimethylallyltransferase n=1 Tax=Sediminibacterium ginsengisoli TaxID=413434 RepID=A0A1T4QFL4_9BACT|nr:tRNA (adenosine(37)-N6)-dimethylallyltransferase MiaA [Sediminibacterium ginsengisoli]SKA02583.1 tRNA dimethylallyltransferase [Sediminibacterium ginsengisoli]